MKLAQSAVLLTALSPLSVLAQGTATTSSPFALYTLSIENLTAVFTPFGGRLTSLLVADRNGNQQDVVTGYDNGTQYLQDSNTNRTYFGAIVGRFANRIKNSTFDIDGQAYHISADDHGGLDTLHGGVDGYDKRNWTVLNLNESSITFSLLDPDGSQGFPGTVYTTATFSLSNYPSGPQGQMRPRLTSQMVSSALDHPTPIMLANHVYWNLNAYQAATIENDTTLWMPYADRYILIDNIEIPTGAIGSVASEGTLDFTSPKLLGPAIANATGVCGFNCTGIDNAFIIDRPPSTSDTAANFPVLSAWSSTTGIQMDVSTNQQGLQIYTCNGQNGTIPVKPSQVKRNQGIKGAASHVNKYGCFVVETQAWIDGINHPEWGVDKYEIFSPTTGPAINYATYDFSTF